MHCKQQFQNAPLHTISRAAVALIIVFAVAVPAVAQNAVPPTARQAASSPAFASRLAHQAATRKAGKARAIVPSRRALPQYGNRYDNGPYNGTTDAWTINFGFTTSDSFTGSGTINGIHFVYWDASTTDLLTTVDLSIGSTSFGGTPQTLTGVTNTFLGTNQFGYSLYQADYSFSGIQFGPGYITLGNACTTSGCSVSNPIYWDENSGIGCQSPGCPSTAYENNLGSIPSESFSLDGSGGCSTDLPAIPRSAQAQTRVVTAPVSPTQTFRVIHDFNFAGPDGGYPAAGLTIDQAGNLYGPASNWGRYNNGNIYKLSPHGSDWIFNVLHSFRGGSDGGNPEGNLTIGRYGILYGTTVRGGGTGCYVGMGCGTVYEVTPSPHTPPAVFGGWTDTILYGFTDGTDGSSPGSDVIFDQAGNLYGATSNGGAHGKGTIYELIPTAGGWEYRMLYSFSGAADGAKPIGNLMFDQSGNLYGAAYTGGRTGCGTIFQLTPSAGGWTENTLYTFRGQDDSGNPLGLVQDQLGNLYGVTIGAGCLAGKCSYGVGASTVFMLSPRQDTWAYTVLSTYAGLYESHISIDASGSLYVAVAWPGQVFRLAPSGGIWTYTDLHDFNGKDGFWPVGKIVVDADGNIYGVTNQGGAYSAGVVWEITP
jgi:uncharacterized repeat protein (TIGR03803 family)